MSESPTTDAQDTLPAVDDPPSSGQWGPEHDDFPITDEDAEAGNRLGASIDIDDDDDNGLDDS